MKEIIKKYKYNNKNTKRKERMHQIIKRKERMHQIIKIKERMQTTYL